MPMPAKRPTIADIARLAGVSKATVSRVLNSKPDVDPVTREHILNLIEEQGFVKSAVATGLAGGRSNLIGMAVRSDTWLFVLEIMRAVSDILDRTHNEIVLYRMNARFPEQDRTFAVNRLLSNNLTAGLLAIFPGLTSPQLQPVSQQGIPLVVIDDEYLLHETPWTGTLVPWISSQNRKGAYEAVRHLIEHGHRRIAYIHGPDHFICARERYEGYCQALEEADIPFDPTLVFEGNFQFLGGHSAANICFSLPAHQLPTAIFAGNDLTAYGVLAAASEHNLRVPDDIALIGFDDLVEVTPELMQLQRLQTALTTVRQPFYDMGRYAAEILLMILEQTSSVDSYLDGRPFSLPTNSPLANYQHEADGVLHIKLPVQLIVRSTCGCPPSAATQNGYAPHSRKHL